jgi:hypothetical protein
MLALREDARARDARVAEAEVLAWEVIRNHIIEQTINMKGFGLRMHPIGGRER